MKRKIALFLLCIVMGIVLSGCLATAQKGAMVQARSSVADGKYEFALQKLGHAESYAETNPELKAEITFLTARCYEGLGRKIDAIALYKYVIEQFPITRYADIAMTRSSTLGSKVSPEKMQYHLNSESYSYTSIMVSDSDGKYWLTVPASRLIVRFPKQDFIRDETKRGGGTDNPRYFMFTDAKTGVSLSGWLESADNFPGNEQNWEARRRTLSQIGAPTPKDVTFTNEGIWHVILYTTPALGASTPIDLPNMYANTVKSGTWIELHLSLNSYAADSYNRLLALLRQVQVQTKPGRL